MPRAARSRSDSTPPVIPCSRCGKEVASAEELRRHFSIEHPLELPALYVAGQPILRETVIRVPVLPTDVELFQCTYCDVQVDGGVWQRVGMQEFRQLFAGTKNSTWNVRLAHNRPEDGSSTGERYEIRFRIPDDFPLNLVDECFVRLLVRDDLRHSDLEQFEHDLPVDTPVREYGGALGDYALGIMLKERRVPPRSLMGFDEFAVKMRSALEVLRYFKRYVALAVSGSVRFILNDFHDPYTETAADLEIGMCFFRSIIGRPVAHSSTALKSTGQKKYYERAVCPLDMISHRLLSACRSLMPGGVLSLDELEALRQLTRGAVPVSEQDLAKIHVICAEGYIRLSASMDALPHLQAVQFVRPFNNWAQRQLESL